VITEVFVAQSQPVAPLRQQLLHGVINQYLLSVIFKALGQRQR
jgi:hypothetical protein